ncbi:MAG: hypothetical protein M1493_13770 [Firmicutes bacterium]|nr:hypothetical protein [Bacillota bacterium]
MGTMLVLFIGILVIVIIGFTTSLSAAVNHKRDQKRSAEREKTQSEIAYLQGRLDELTRNQDKGGNHR